MDWPDTSLTLIQFIPLDVEPLGPMSPHYSQHPSYHCITLLWLNTNHVNYLWWMVAYALQILRKDWFLLQ